MAGKTKNLLDQRFTMLLVVKQAEDRKRKCGRKSTAWECKCDCGNTKEFLARTLLRGDAKSCGCSSRKIACQTAGHNYIGKLEDNTEQHKAYSTTYNKEYYLKNKEKLDSDAKEYYHKNKAVIVSKPDRKVKRTEYMRKKRKECLFTCVSSRLRNRLNKALKGNYKSGSAVTDLGCSVEDFISHLESQFSDGMSWENRSEWHIDHIKPLSSFDLALPEELKRACHYSNLQPLWAKDNYKKGCK